MFIKIKFRWLINVDNNVILDLNQLIVSFHTFPEPPSGIFFYKFSVFIVCLGIRWHPHDWFLYVSNSQRSKLLSLIINYYYLHLLFGVANPDWWLKQTLRACDICVFYMSGCFPFGPVRFPSDLGYLLKHRAWRR